MRHNSCKTYVYGEGDLMKLDQKKKKERERDIKKSWKLSYN